MTRPEPGLSATLPRVESLGWRPIAAPMLLIRHCPLRLDAHGFDHVLLGSGQAVPSLVGVVPFDASLLTVGAATAQRAREAGFQCVRSADGDAAALLTLLGSPTGGGSRVLLPIARRQGAVLAQGARQQGWRVTRRVVYRAQAATKLPSPAARELATGTVDAVLLFSAATAVAFLRCVSKLPESARSPIRAIALSEQVAVPLRAAGWSRLEVAARPEQAALLDVLGRNPRSESRDHE
ncbi:uroporphyrinogen-III synthase [Neoasaia chiangmaiensis NBRC 101099]|uniref:Uncharacterized protein n=1 Tax=Neoasaia chiangmaiensis TaxID=320497 RepID=A0A1U9KMY1_9PROT|nr:uroporphyrinogen-III synthase [Neoasaia chiangmaiensis]AQS87152.1 hypothetical protein A0U93_03495 [Neoasaia chiangmaiensis]GBR38178.1 uroporphyrinogen-III synthase [Neoasaia chiangmaiensis NBRC 101099]GEN16004.1 uroporphyrinogen III methyltransferase [Neoasaia chiangmaiensis]